MGPGRGVRVSIRVHGDRGLQNRNRSLRSALQTDEGAGIRGLGVYGFEPLAEGLWVWGFWSQANVFDRSSLGFSTVKP